MDEIKTSYLDISQRGITTENLAKFKGVDRQLLIEVEPSGSMRPVLMDGKTLGGKDKLVLKSEFDAIKDNIASTESFVDKTSAQEISGLKTFTTLPQSSVDPTNDSDLVTKKYADKSATNTQKGVVQLQNTVDNTENKAATPRAVNSVKTMVEDAQESIEAVNTVATGANRVALEAKSQANTNATSIGTLGSLTTTAKTNLVNAINEVNIKAKDANIAKKNINNSFSADQTFTKNISVTGTTTLTGNLTSNGTTITKAIDCNGNADVSGTLAVTGTTTLKGATTLTGATKIVDDTFTYDGANILVTKKDDWNIISKTSKVAKGTNPTTAQRFHTYLTDKDSSPYGENLLAGLLLGYETSGDSQARLFACNTNAGSSSNANIGIMYDKSANKFITYAPTPVDSSNTTEIATTAWVRKNATSFISGITLPSEYTLSSRFRVNKGSSVVKTLTGSILGFIFIGEDRKSGIHTYRSYMSDIYINGKQAINLGNHKFRGGDDLLNSGYSIVPVFAYKNLTNDNAGSIFYTTSPFKDTSLTILNKDSEAYFEVTFILSKNGSLT